MDKYLWFLEQISLKQMDLELLGPRSNRGAGS